MAPRRQRSHFAIPHDQHLRCPQRADRRIVRRDVQPIIRAMARHRLADQRQPQGVERRQHRFELPQVGPMVLTVPLLQQAVGGRWLVIDTDTRTVETDRISGQTIDPHPLLEHRGVQRCLDVYVAQHGQDVSQPIIGAVGVAQGDGQQGRDRLRTVRHPIAHR